MVNASRDRVIKMVYSSDFSSSKYLPRREREVGQFNMVKATWKRIDNIDMGAVRTEC